MKIEFGFSKKRMLLLGTIGIIVVLTVSAFLFLNTGQVTQAAVIQPHPGLVGWWRFNDGSGTVASDSSGFGNKGAIYGATWVAGLYGGDALSFNGVSDYVSIPDSPSLEFGTGSFSVAAWLNPQVKTNGASWENNAYLDMGSYSVFLSVLRNDNGFRVYLSDGTHNVDHSTFTTLTAGTWIYVVVVVSRATNTAYLYLNSALIDSWSISAITGSLGSAASNSNVIGSSLATNGEYFTGTVDNVQIYNRALSATEIQSDFEQAPDFSPYLLANVPQGTTQVITTLSWQGTGNINVTITTPSQTYTESMMQEYLKTTYSTTGGGPMSMLNIKRLSISVTALTSAQTWNITLTYDNTVSAYQISVETQN
jgi:hypothetical protein